jgi:type I restriction enzyme S subunit
MVGPCLLGAIFSGFIIRFRLDSIEVADPNFLNYVLRSPAYRELLTRIGSGTTITNLSQDTLAGIEIDLPLLPEQRAIAHFLGTLDDKIELNRRMNQTLEAITRALFQSWFVDFGPVHAKAEGREPAGMDAETAALFPDSFQESKLGLIPEGWEVTTIGNVAKINARSLKPSLAPDTIHYVDISSVERGRLLESREVAFSEAPSRARRLVEAGDTIWSCVRPNREGHWFVQSPDPNLVVSTGFAVIHPLQVSANFLNLWTTEQAFVDYLTSNADGSAYPAVRASHFEAASILAPSPSVSKAFERVAAPLRRKQHANRQESESLAAIRDALLPKLISGQLRVPDAEKLLAESPV